MSFALAFHEATLDTVEPLYRDTLSFDRNRLGEIEAQIKGVPYETDDPSWAITKALESGAMQDPDILRGYVDIAGLTARADEVLARPGLFERVLEVAAKPADPAPGPSRAELLDIVRG